MALDERELVEDEAILDMIGGEDFAECGEEGDYTLFEAAAGYDMDDEDDEVGGRKARRRRRKKRRKRRRRRFKKGFKFVKKIANNKLVRAVSKSVLMAVPGGQAIVAISTAARMAAKVVKAAKKGSKVARRAIRLARRAKRGDRRALATLRSAARGGKKFLPGRFRGEHDDVRVTMPGGSSYDFDLGSL